MAKLVVKRYVGKQTKGRNGHYQTHNIQTIVWMQFAAPGEEQKMKSNNRKSLLVSFPKNFQTHTGHCAMSRGSARFTVVPQTRQSVVDPE